jgi:hypothetical protein
MNRKLDGMGLPASLEFCDLDHIPAKLQAKSDEARETGGPEMINSSFAELQVLSMKCTRSIRVAWERLDEEETGDARIRERYGSDRRASKELNEGFRVQIKTLQKKMVEAESSDTVIEKMIVEDMPAVIALCQEKSKLGAYIPKSKKSSVNDGIVRDLRGKLEDLNTLMQKRKEILDTLTSAVRADEISSQLLESVSKMNLSEEGKLPENCFEDLFEERLGTLFEKPRIELNNGSRMQEILMKQILVWRSF